MCHFLQFDAYYSCYNNKQSSNICLGIRSVSEVRRRKSAMVLTMCYSSVASFWPWALFTATVFLSHPLSFTSGLICMISVFLLGRAFLVHFSLFCNFKATLTMFLAVVVLPHLVYGFSKDYAWWRAQTGARLSVLFLRYAFYCCLSATRSHRSSLRLPHYFQIQKQKKNNRWKRLRFSHFRLLAWVKLFHATTICRPAHHGTVEGEKNTTKA